MRRSPKSPRRGAVLELDVWLFLQLGFHEVGAISKGTLPGTARLVAAVNARKPAFCKQDGRQAINQASC